MSNLLEAYKKRITIAESVYSKAHQGETMSNTRKLAVAKCLENVNKFMNEAFANSVGTQQADMGLWKKFCLNLTNVALPNLIAPELVIVHPMSSMSGSIAYVKYVAASNKGDVKRGDKEAGVNPTLFNSPFQLGNYDQNYTSERVVETVSADGTIKLSWTPIVKGAFKDADGNPADVKITHKIGDPTYMTLTDGQEELTGLTEGDRVAYVYDNVSIPQNDIPMIRAEVDSIPLLAKARRIAVYYSQMAAFQAKTDYGFDLGDQLAEQAVGQLSYEIDTEVVQLLIDNATGPDGVDLTWSKTLDVGVSKAEHYEGFTEIIERARQVIYDRTKRFAPNYMLISSDILPILVFIKGFQAAPAGVINGPYLAGTLNGLKVFVAPNMPVSTFVIGVNGDDLMSSAAVYAPYMPIVPTQLLQYADGGNSQGWSTLYDLKMLNANLLVKGTVTANQ